MSKKKKKFKKIKSHPASTAQGQPANTVQPTDNTEVKETIVKTEETAEKIVADDPYNTTEYDHVKKDIKKILFIIGIIIILFVGVSILNAKTSVLTSFGDWIYKIADIQAQ